VWRIHDRISFVSDLLRNKEFSPIIISFKVGPDGYTGWYKLRASKHNTTIYIAEYISRGNIEKYSYVLLIDTEVILRYDNAPHFPEIHTYPHHKHYKDKVYPLEKHEVKDFIKEASKIIETNK